MRDKDFDIKNPKKKFQKTERVPPKGYDNANDFFEDMYMDKDACPNKGAYFLADLKPNDDPNYNRQVIFGKPNFIIANLAIGGVFTGIYNINSITALADGPRSMYIDWIRIYQRGDANESFVCPSASDPIEPERTENNLSPTLPSREGEKVLRNGQLLIRLGEKMYDIMGKEVTVKY